MIGYVGAAATKSIILGAIVLVTAGFFVPLKIAHPLWMLAFLVLTAVTFSMFGFNISSGMSPLAADLLSFFWASGNDRQTTPLMHSLQCHGASF